MKKRWLNSLVLILGCSLVIGCAAQKPAVTFQPYDFGPQLRSGQYFQKVDNFLLLMDASGSMGEQYKGRSKLDITKDTAGRMNRTMSALTLKGALRTFGGSISPFKKTTRLVYGLTEYNADGFDSALQSVRRAGGQSPMSMAMDAAGGDLKSAQGEIAIVIIGDGKEIDASPITSAIHLKDQLGDGVCIHTVLVGNNAKGKALMEKIAQASRCGFSVSADEIADSEQMAGFVQKVFFGKKEILDSDGDGVNDDKDQCPDTPILAMVDQRGCPLDTDGDGVYDYLDQCPGTPHGVSVDKWGCPADSDRDGVYDADDMCPDTPYGAEVNEKGCWVLKGILFDSGKWDIKSEMSPILDEVVVVLQKQPALSVEIQGHTDSMGDVAYNKKLSENRAKAVMEYFVKKGVGAKRLSAAGLGETRPIASNDTAEGRAMNRRVQLNPMY
jgi:OOP family OmpA-OmpF porin